MHTHYTAQSNERSPESFSRHQLTGRYREPHAVVATPACSQMFSLARHAALVGSVASAVSCFCREFRNHMATRLDCSTAAPRRHAQPTCCHGGSRAWALQWTDSALRLPFTTWRSDAGHEQHQHLVGFQTRTAPMRGLQTATAALRGCVRRSDHVKKRSWLDPGSPCTTRARLQSDEAPAAAPCARLVALRVTLPARHVVQCSAL